MKGKGYRKNKGGAGLAEKRKSAANIEKNCDGVVILPNVHYLKILTNLFIEVKDGIKEFEAKNDKSFEVGDTLIFEELNRMERHTGAWVPKLIIYKHDEAKETVILGIQDIKF